MLVDQLAFLTVKIPVVHFWQSIQDCFYLQLDCGAGLMALSPVQHKACGENTIFLHYFIIKYIKTRNKINRVVETQPQPPSFLFPLSIKTK